MCQRQLYSVMLNDLHPVLFPMITSSFFSAIIPSSPQGLCVPLHQQYVGEISPKKLRGFANSTSSFFWTLGKVIGQISGQRYNAIDYPHNSFLDPFYLLLLPLLLHPFLSLLKANAMNLYSTHMFYPHQGATGQPVPVAHTDGLLWTPSTGPAGRTSLLPRVPTISPHAYRRPGSLQKR